MMVTWLIQSNLLSNDQIYPLVDSLKDQNILFKDVSVIPFCETIDMPDLEGDKIIPYGSTKLINYCKTNGWKGLFFSEENLKTSTWIKNRNDVLNYDAKIMSFSEAYDFFSKNKGTWFIKPDNDLKAFAGNLIDSEEFMEWSDRISCGGFLFEKDIPIVISTPKNIKCEWRYFIIGGEIITGSIYRVNGRMQKSSELDTSVIQEAQEMADKWLPDECVVMDLALTDDGLKLIEFNCINCSGFYKHDIKAFTSQFTNYVNKL